MSIARRHPRLRINRRALASLIHTLDARFAVRPGDLPRRRRRTSKSAVPDGELSLVFLTDPALARLHADFMADPSTTDVITFEGDPALGSAGEICVSVDTAAEYARRHRHELDPELTLYVIHGWLHLAGYDDLSPARKRVMRRAEARARRIWAEQGGCNPIFRLLPFARHETSPAPVDRRVRPGHRDRPARPRRR